MFLGIPIWQSHRAASQKQSWRQSCFLLHLWNSVLWVGQSLWVFTYQVIRALTCSCIHKTKVGGDMWANLGCTYKERGVWFSCAVHPPPGQCSPPSDALLLLRRVSRVTDTESSMHERQETVSHNLYYLIQYELGYPKQQNNAESSESYTASNVWELHLSHLLGAISLAECSSNERWEDHVPPWVDHTWTEPPASYFSALK